MISIRLVKATHFKSLYVEGHALFADYGNDIVCASVSTASILTSNMLEQFSSVETHIESGNLRCLIISPNAHTDKVMFVMLKAMEDLVREYPKHITLDIIKE
jgi:uncharacterized protein YsxB (DUF464 family)